jgi:predicted MFS family arabinose efflux permease
VFGARRSVIVASSPTGAALGGLLLEHFGASQVVALSGLACVAGGLLCLCLPSVRATKPEPAEPEPVRPEPEPEPEPV